MVRKVNNSNSFRKFLKLKRFTRLLPARIKPSQAAKKTQRNCTAKKNET